MKCWPAWALRKQRLKLRLPQIPRPRHAKKANRYSYKHHVPNLFPANAPNHTKYRNTVSMPFNASLQPYLHLPC